MNNRFLVLEGIDGSGKSSLIQSLSKCLSRRFYIGNIKTCEPTFGDYGMKARWTDDPRQQLMLFMLDRLEHTVKIEEWLNNAWVLSDRFDWSTIVYNFEQEVNETPYHNWANIMFPSAPKPAYIYLEIETQKAYERICNRAKLSIGEHASPEYPFDRLDYYNHRYKALAKRYIELGYKVVVLDGNKGHKENIAQIISELSNEPHPLSHSKAIELDLIDRY